MSRNEGQGSRIARVANLQRVGSPAAGETERLLGDAGSSSQERPAHAAAVHFGVEQAAELPGVDVWKRAQDPRTSRVYYANVETRKTQWNKPLSGWLQVQDRATGRAYYCNLDTKETRWSDPRKDKPPVSATAALISTARAAVAHDDRGGGAGGGGSSGNNDSDEDDGDSDADDAEGAGEGAESRPLLAASAGGAAGAGPGSGSSAARRRWKRAAAAATAAAAPSGRTASKRKLFSADHMSDAHVLADVAGRWRGAAGRVGHAVDSGAARFATAARLPAVNAQLSASASRFASAARSRMHVTSKFNPPIAQAASDRVLHRDFGLKQAGTSGGWKHRYFALTEKHVSYFDAPDGECKGSLRLRPYTYVCKSTIATGCLALFTSTRVLYFCGETPFTTQRWREALKAVVTPNVMRPVAGVLRKRMKTTKLWKERYFVLFGMALLWFEWKGGAFKGKMSLDFAHATRVMVDRNPFCIKLGWKLPGSGQRKQLIMAASGLREYKLWERALTRHMKYNGMQPPKDEEARRAMRRRHRERRRKESQERKRELEERARALGVHGGVSAESAAAALAAKAEGGPPPGDAGGVKLSLLQRVLGRRPRANPFAEGGGHVGINPLVRLDAVEDSADTWGATIALLEQQKQAAERQQVAQSVTELSTRITRLNRIAAASGGGAAGVAMARNRGNRDRANSPLARDPEPAGAATSAASSKRAARMAGVMRSLRARQVTPAVAVAKAEAYVAAEVRDVTAVASAAAPRRAVSAGLAATLATAGTVRGASEVGASVRVARGRLLRPSVAQISASARVVASMAEEAATTLDGATRRQLAELPPAQLAVAIRVAAARGGAGTVEAEDADVADALGDAALGALVVLAGRAEELGASLPDGELASALGADQVLTATSAAVRAQVTSALLIHHAIADSAHGVRAGGGTAGGSARSGAGVGAAQGRSLAVGGVRPAFSHTVRGPIGHKVGLGSSVIAEGTEEEEDGDEEEDEDKRNGRDSGSAALRAAGAAAAALGAIGGAGGGEDGGGEEEEDDEGGYEPVVLVSAGGEDELREQGVDVAALEEEAVGSGEGAAGGDDDDDGEDDIGDLAAAGDGDGDGDGDGGGDGDGDAGAADACESAGAALDGAAAGAVSVAAGGEGSPTEASPAAEGAAPACSAPRSARESRALKAIASLAQQDLQEQREQQRGAVAEGARPNFVLPTGEASAEESVGSVAVSRAGAVAKKESLLAQMSRIQRIVLTRAQSTLQTSGPLSICPMDEVGEMVAACDTLSYRSGDVIVTSASEDADCLFFVVSGTVSVVGAATKRLHRELVRRYNGDAFGAKNVIQSKLYRAFYCTAKTDLECLRLSPSAVRVLQRVLGRSSVLLGVLERMLRSAAGDLADDEGSEDEGAALDEVEDYDGDE